MRQTIVKRNEIIDTKYIAVASYPTREMSIYSAKCNTTVTLQGSINAANVQQEYTQSAASVVVPLQSVALVIWFTGTGKGPVHFVCTISIVITEQILI